MNRLISETFDTSIVMVNKNNILLPLPIMVSRTALKYHCCYQFLALKLLVSIKERCPLEIETSVANCTTR